MPIPFAKFSRRDRLQTVTRLTVVALEARDVPSAEPVGQVFLQYTPDDTDFSQLYGMKKIQAPEAWDVSTGNPAVVVADIDSGVDYNHPDLWKNIWLNQGELPKALKDEVITSPITFYDLNMRDGNGNLVHAAWDVDGSNRIDAKDALTWATDGDSDGNTYPDDIIGWNFVADNNNPFDDNGHGTHTAGTIGAMGNNTLGVVGVNWQVQIMPLKFIAGDGSGSLDWAASAIRYSVDQHASVSNNSWLYYGGTTNDVIYQAVSYAQAHNQLVVAAAGNDGFNNDSSPWRAYPASFSFSNVISVAATDSNDNKANWSNWGKTTVDLGAPGVSVLSTVPGGYDRYSGTSMATPHVSGTAALILAARPDLANSPGTIKSLILNNVDRVKSLGNKVLTGGRLNAFKALNAALTAPGGSGSPAPSGGSGVAGGSSENAAVANLVLNNAEVSDPIGQRQSVANDLPSGDGFDTLFDADDLWTQAFDNESSTTSSLDLRYMDPQAVPPSTSSGTGTAWLELRNVTSTIGEPDTGLGLTASATNDLDGSE